MKGILTILMASALISSCLSYTDGSQETPDSTAPVLVTVGAGGLDTRSSFSWSDSDVRDLQVIVTQEDGSLVKSIYTDKSGSIIFTGTVGKEYTFHAVANFGHEINAGDSEDFMMSAVSTDFDSVQTHGIPMTSTEEIRHTVTRGDNTLVIPLKRLLARIDFSVDKSLMRHGEDGFTIKSVKIFNGRDNGHFDHAGSSDLNILNQGGVISLYAFENMQGDLLRGNTDPWKKVPENLVSSEMCSYLEMTASYSAQGLAAENLTYRMYLGSDATSNFDVRRNTVYRLTLFPSEEEMDGHRGSWKISTSDWSDSRTLRLSPSAIKVKYGSSSSSQIVMTPEDFDVSVIHTGWLTDLGCTFRLDPVSNILTVTNRSSLTKDVTDYVTVRSWDGRLEAKLTVTVAKKDVTTHKMVLTPSALLLKEGERSSVSVIYQTLVNGVPTSSTDVTARCTWSSSDSAVAKVSGGTVQAVKSGSTQITARYTDGVNGSFSSTCTVTVTADSGLGVTIGWGSSGSDVNIGF